MWFSTRIACMGLPWHKRGWGASFSFSGAWIFLATGVSWRCALCGVKKRLEELAHEIISLEIRHQAKRFYDRQALKHRRVPMVRRPANVPDARELRDE
jgi:hypothetical protein